MITLEGTMSTTRSILSAALPTIIASAAGIALAVGVAPAGAHAATRIPAQRPGASARPVDTHRTTTVAPADTHWGGTVAPADTHWGGGTGQGVDTHWGVTVVPVDTHWGGTPGQGAIGIA